MPSPKGAVVGLTVCAVAGWSLWLAPAVRAAEASAPSYCEIDVSAPATTITCPHVLAGDTVQAGDTGATIIVNGTNAGTILGGAGDDTIKVTGANGKPGANGVAGSYGKPGTDASPGTHGAVANAGVINAGSGSNTIMLRGGDGGAGGRGGDGGRASGRDEAGNAGQGGDGGDGASANTGRIVTGGGSVTLTGGNGGAAGARWRQQPLRLLRRPRRPWRCGWLRRRGRSWIRHRDRRHHRRRCQHHPRHRRKGRRRRKRRPKTVCQRRRQRIWPRRRIR